MLETTAKTPSLVSEYFKLIHEALYWEAGFRASEADWKKAVEGLSTVQKKVHMAGRWTEYDRQDLEKRLFDEARETYRQGLQDELYKWGCAGQRAIAPSAGEELSAIKERCVFASTSVMNTYNLELAREIERIGEEVPTANRHVYAYRLFYQSGAWDGAYWDDKSVQVGQIETMTMVNAAVQDFYARNGDVLQPEANVMPLAAVCEDCKEAVSGNPYKSVDEVFRKWDLPLHCGCPHHAESSPDRRLTSQECQRLWAG